MKRKSVKLLLCSALLAMALAVSACGGKKDDKEAADSTPAPTEELKEEEPTEEPTEAPVEEETPAEEEAPADAAAEDTGRIDASEEEEEMLLEKFATVKEFAESDMIQEEIAGLKAAMEGSGMDITVTGEDDKLIYTYTYAELEGMEGLAEQLEQAMELQAETFKAVAASIREAVDVENPVVVVTYVDANGEEIYTAEFAAE